MKTGGKLYQRVAKAAHATLTERGVVTPIDILLGVGWLTPARLEDWRRGRVPYLERITNAGLGKLGTALRLLKIWATRAGLNPRETVYVAWTPKRPRLRFSKTGDEHIERAYRTHWVSPALTEAAKARKAEKKRVATEASQLAPADDVPVSPPAVEVAASSTVRVGPPTGAASEATRRPRSRPAPDPPSTAQTSVPQQTR